MKASDEDSSQVQVRGEDPSPLALLFSDEDEEEVVKMVRVKDKGSQARRAKVLLQGHPVEGIVDSGADITIVNGRLFKEVAEAVRLRKKDFQPPDKTPRTYDRQTFTLDGRMNLDVSFGDRTMCTPIYIKMDAHDDLLLSEGVCRQLGIIEYHPEVLPHQEGIGEAKPTDPVVPVVRVRLLQATRLLPQQSTVVSVRVDGVPKDTGPLLLEPETLMEGVCVEPTLVAPDQETHVLVTNTSHRGWKRGRW